MRDRAIARDGRDIRAHLKADTGSPGGVRYWKPALDLICAQVEAGTVTPHLHDEWQFAVPSQPAALLVGAFRRYVVGAGEVTVVQPYDVHGESGGGSWSVLYVPRAVLEHHFLGRPARPVTCRVVPDAAAGGELRALLSDNDRAVIDGVRFEALALDWLERLAQRQATCPAPRPHRARPSVERVRALLRERPTEPVSLAEAASVAGVAPSHLVRSFSRDVGLPPKSYHAQARLALARRLLAEGKPATWVAYECGFADQSHLSRRFKESYGLTPGTFQAQCGSRRGAVPGSDAA